ncbi:Uncharacterised protein [uncultured archaeon]|nr:Uncharacterised protein [uncultured archaeon]
MTEIVRIPHERISALRGDGDATLQMLERKLKCSMDVSDEGDVELEGEPVDEFFGKSVIRAIGRGFEPHIALKLLKDDYGFHLIDLRDYASKPDAMTRIKGRVIGEKGKARQIVEQEGECNLAIWGHTVGVIGRLETLDIATTAVFKLIEGQPHPAVFMYLEKNRRRREQDEKGMGMWVQKKPLKEPKKAKE